MRFIEKIFSITNCDDRLHKLITFLGLRVKFKVNNTYLTQNDIRKLLQANNPRILNGVQRSITTAILHQKSFSGYKNKYQGKSVVLVGAGPTLNYFTGVKDAIYIGCNRAFLFDKIKFDYLFSIDNAGLKNDSESYYDDFFHYEGNNCIKFIGDQNLGKNFQIPESYILKYDNILRYKTTAGYMSNRLTFDISSEPLGNFSTVSLQALQFILYTNPAKVYLVGIDCNGATAGHFIGKKYDNAKRNENAKLNDSNNIKSWSTTVRDFLEIYYPETEIISVNPVGLRGVFKDVYTHSYVEANAELFKNVAQIDYIDRSLIEV